MISCIVDSSYTIPVPFVDITGMTIDFDNFGTAIVSFAMVHDKDEELGGGRVTFTINGVKFIAFVETLSPAPIEGTDYFETRVTVKGFGC